MDRDIPMSVKMGAKSFGEIRDLHKGRTIDEAGIAELCDFVNYRLDCSDFRMVTILRTLFSYKEQLSQETIQRMTDSVLGFKYWMDEPGDDSMCYWSENHQILFFSCAYLAGKLFPEDLFSNSGKRGKELVEIFRPRILAWMKERFEHGFVEWHSNTYYEEDIAPLALLIDFAEEDLQIKGAIILDLLAADMAMHSYKGLFSVTSGRCYEDQKREPLKQDTLEVMEFFFGNRYLQEFDYSRISSSLYLCTNYSLPTVITLIAADKKNVVVKTSMGHNVTELGKIAGDKGQETADYLQWAMESFTNPEIITNTMKMYRKYNMKSNDFLKDFSMLDIPGTGFLLPSVSRLLKPMHNGVAIQKVNSYTCKTENYILSTAQNYHPGTFGDQQHIWQATINEKISVFTTHPGLASFDDNARSFSPSYWVGNGIHPHSVQHENIVLSIYDVTGRKGFLEKQRQQYTHAHFPVKEFDRVHLEGPYAFGLSGNTKVALIGSGDLAVNPEDEHDLILKGTRTSWVCELSGNDETFDMFIERIKNTKRSFKGKSLSYGAMTLRYKGNFSVDGEIINTEYSRLESPYGNWNRCDDELHLTCGGHQLRLNLDKNVREWS